MESEEKNIYEKKNHHCSGSHRRYSGSSRDYFNFGTDTRYRSDERKDNPEFQFSACSFHKARVAADWANLRAYYSEIQTDFIATGKSNPAVPTDEKYHTEITFLDGQTVKLKAGQIVIQGTRRCKWICIWISDSI